MPPTVDQARSLDDIEAAPAPLPFSRLTKPGSGGTRRIPQAWITDTPPVEQIVAAITAQRTQSGHEDELQMEWNGDAIIETDPAYIGREGYQPTRIEPDQDGMYPIGAYSWTWSEL